ncbi:MAG TPA: pyridoxamine 5'-phosphate oxidase family protein [Candidatus Tectomicrobia bacterium]|jgi:pyridoxamine 5'-phosphate oxidase
MDPVAEIIARRAEARQQQDPQVDVCFLATVTAEARPAVRAISLRDIDARGFSLLLNETSPKWQQLTARGQCALHILWSTVRRQYRVYGRLDPMDPAHLQQYWNRKGHGSRLLEYYYEACHAQSQPIPSRAYLLQGMAELTQRYPDKDAMPLPPDTLKGVYLYPTEIDVWHGSPEDRLHDRCLCTRTATGWSSYTLVP